MGLKITMRVISLKITCRNIVLQSAAIALVNSFIPQPNILLHHPDIPAVTLQQVNQFHLHGLRRRFVTRQSLQVEVALPLLRISGSAMAVGILTIACPIGASALSIGSLGLVV